jgi:hypothetical protein
MSKRFSTPGIFRKEVDVSEVLSPTGTSTGVIIGGATKGPANARTLIGTDKELTSIFGKPQASWSKDFGIYAGLEFLRESSSLYFTRVTDGTEQYSHFYVSAHSSTSANTPQTTTITAYHTSAYSENGKDANKSDEIWDLDSPSAQPSGTFLVSYVAPGVEGNTVGVKLTTSATYTTASISADIDWAYNYDDTNSDGTPSSASDAIWKKVFKLDVFVKSTSAEILTLTSANDSNPDETFYGTIGDYKAPDGSQLNIEQIVNGVSKYIYVNNKGMTDGTVPKHTNGAPQQLTQGSGSVTEIGLTPIVNGYDFYSDRNKVDINIMIGSYADSTVSNQKIYANKIDSVITSRVDCIATVQVASTNGSASSTYIANDSFSFANPSYIAKYAGWDVVYDSFNDKKRYIPKSIFGAVLMARTDRVSDTWKAPAGVNRGILPVIDQDLRFTDAQIGNMYDNNINTSKFVKGTGHVMWGQRTAQRKVSALREIAVRRLLLYIENSVEPFLLNFLFEPNNASTRLRVASLLDNFLSTVSGGGGLEAYSVVVDETNNTAQDIDNNLLNISIYIQPTRNIEFIQLQVIITRTGVAFSEI